MARILLIDDDDRLVSLLRNALERKGHEVRCEETAEPALELLAEREFDVVVVDYSLPGGMTGIDFLKALRRQDVSVPVIVMTGYDLARDMEIRARQLGARDYVLKPWDFKQLVNELEPVIDEMLEVNRLNREPVHLPPSDRPLPRDISGPVLLGNSQPMKEVRKRIAAVAEGHQHVLILGETGTGKELIARAIFHHSDRKDRPFVVVNCAAIPEQLLESVLFGHEKGSFTDAKCLRVGKFEQADGGTILLDEIGEMSSTMQAKILRVLQEGEVERLGRSEMLKVDVRVIACTNRDLEAAMSGHTFRPDLYHRLRGAEIRLPPLRERGPDIDLLAGYFLDRERQEMGRPLLTFHETALQKLHRHPWPGNVRELENAMELAARVCEGPQVMPEHLELGPGAAREKYGPGKEEALAGLRAAIRWAWDTGENDLWWKLEDCLWQELRQFALGKLGKKAAADRLGISRTTLDKWLEEGKPSRKTSAEA
jgi:DNA-binding NtrC family response regulator